MKLINWSTIGRMFLTKNFILVPFLFTLFCIPTAAYSEYSCEYADYIKENKKLTYGMFRGKAKESHFGSSAHISVQEYEYDGTNKVWMITGFSGFIWPDNVYYMTSIKAVVAGEPPIRLNTIKLKKHKSEINYSDDPEKGWSAFRKRPCWFVSPEVYNHPSRSFLLCLSFDSNEGLCYPVVANRIQGPKN